MKNDIVFSVVIPTFNAKSYLLPCLNSIFKSNAKNYEIIIVDNGSTDNTTEALKEKFYLNLNKIKVVELDKNYGPALARNKGVENSSGEYLCFLDSDTEVDPNWSIEVLKLFQKNRKVAAVQSKLLLYSDRNKIDYLGEYLGCFGFLTPLASYGEKDNGQYNYYYKILAAKSAGMFIKKDIFNEVGGFDSDYFIFLEETDLQWRCWLAGYEILLCPKSVVYHHFSSTKNIVGKNINNYLVRYHGTKNYILTLIKNFSFPYLLKIIPIHIILWFTLSVYLLFCGSGESAKNIMKGILWNISNINNSLRKRRIIQKKRVVEDSILFLKYKLMKDISLKMLIQRFNRSQKEIITPENKI